MSSVARKGQVGIASVACLQAKKYRARVVFEFVGCCTGDQQRFFARAWVFGEHFRRVSRATRL